MNWKSFASLTLATATLAGLALSVAPRTANADGRLSGNTAGNTTNPGAIAPEVPYSDLPTEIQLTGTLRDFKELSETGGHPDFEKVPTGNYGQYLKIVADTLDADGKPVFSSMGYKLSSQYRDASGRNIIGPKDYIASRTGDQAGTLAATTGGAVTSAERLAQWFRDVPGLNMSKALTVTLRRPSGSNVYTFDDRSDPDFTSRNGFFPLNNELFGNSARESKNFHFTFELPTEFVYERGTGQVFTFTGDDDVWVFIDNKLVIDIGGVHSAVSQTIDLDRLSWLESGRVYSLRFFFAERHRSASNCRIDTTLKLRTVEKPQTTALFD